MTYLHVVSTTTVTFEDKHEGLFQPNLCPNLHLWREILLNASPNTNCEPFQDRHGWTYWLEIDHSEAGVTLIVHHRGGHIARAVVKWARPDEAILEDLLVAFSSRKRGLASRLLDHAITLTKQHGARCLTGRVIRKDAERNPSLLDWYRRRGFDVEPVQAVPPAEPLRSLSRAAQQSQPQFETVATIRLNLDTVSPRTRH